MKSNPCRRRNRKAWKNARHWPPRSASSRTRERDLQQQLSDLQAGLEELRQQRETANAALTETKVAWRAKNSSAPPSKASSAALEQRIRELRQLVEQRRREIDSFINRKGQAESEMQESRQQIESPPTRARTGQRPARRSWLARKEAQEQEIATREEALRERAPPPHGNAATARRPRSGTGPEKHGGAKPARAHSAEVPAQPGRRAQRVHHHHLRRPRAPPASRR